MDKIQAGTHNGHHDVVRICLVGDVGTVCNDGVGIICHDGVVKICHVDVETGVGTIYHVDDVCTICHADGVRQHVGTICHVDNAGTIYHFDAEIHEETIYHNDTGKHMVITCPLQRKSAAPRHQYHILGC